MNTLNNNPIELAKTALEDSNELLRTITDEGVEQSLAQIHDNLNVIELLSAAQEEREPSAFAVVSKLGGIHKLSIKRDSAERKAEAWRAEWPNNECAVRPLYLDPPSSDQVWNEAVEAAAKLCNSEAQKQSRIHQHADMYAADRLAREIRSLKRPLQAQEPEHFDSLAVRALAKSFLENPREASLEEQAMLRHAAASASPAAQSGAVDSQSSPVTDELPLPEPFDMWHETDDDAGAWGRPSRPIYTADQIHERDAMWRAKLNAALSRAQTAQQIEFIDAWQCKHTLSVEVAAKELKALYDAWPGGLAEIESAINTARQRAAQQAQAVSLAGVSDELRDKVRGAVAEAIGCLAYDCTRIWSAWGVGTMSEDDFVPIADDSDRVAEIADAAIDALLSQSAAPVSEQPAQEDFCDANCTWLDHAPGCIRAAPQPVAGHAPRKIEGYKITTIPDEGGKRLEFLERDYATALMYHKHFRDSELIPLFAAHPQAAQDKGGDK